MLVRRAERARLDQLSRSSGNRVRPDQSAHRRWRNSRVGLLIVVFGAAATLFSIASLAVELSIERTVSPVAYWFEAR
jgi:hypothetical protein